MNVRRFCGSFYIVFMMIRYSMLFQFLFYTVVST
jgi:hypothetical protein